MPVGAVEVLCIRQSCAFWAVLLGLPTVLYTERGSTGVFLGFIMSGEQLQGSLLQSSGTGQKVMPVSTAKAD